MERSADDKPQWAASALKGTMTVPPHHLPLATGSPKASQSRRTAAAAARSRVDARRRRPSAQTLSERPGDITTASRACSGRFQGSINSEARVMAAEFQQRRRTALQRCEARIACTFSEHRGANPQDEHTVKPRERERELTRRSVKEFLCKTGRADETGSKIRHCVDRESALRHGAVSALATESLPAKPTQQTASPAANRERAGMMQNPFLSRRRLKHARDYSTGLSR
ncbi:hypothetical protein HPB50_018464 [Hyalomma asiaticum]|uniref:Uncharacterized protein n=1 Tax=Hyalomma asiaticum TaxID=266040 RepID=A0ACB7TJU9_HYAAI|nr:hypothetical protein HPB50_018464 [Hyalomma asiaticum]